MEWTFATVSLVIFSSAVVFGVAGFGFGLVAVPVLAILVDPAFGVIAATALGIPLGGSIIVRDHRHISWRPVAVIVGLSLPGYPVGLIVLLVTPSRLLQLIIGVCVVVFAFVHILKIQFRLNLFGVAVGGFVSGVLATSTSMNGPPVVAALQGLGLGPRAFRVSMAVVLFVSKLIAFAVFLLAGSVSADDAIILLSALPACLGGVFVGDHIFSSISSRSLKRVVGFIFLASGVVAIVKSFN